MSRLRRMVERNPSQPSHLMSDRASGYWFEASPRLQLRESPHPILPGVPPREVVGLLHTLCMFEGPVAFSELECFLPGFHGLTLREAAPYIDSTMDARGRPAFRLVPGLGEKLRVALPYHERREFFDRHAHVVLARYPTAENTRLELEIAYAELSAVASRQWERQPKLAGRALESLELAWGVGFRCQVDLITQVIPHIEAVMASTLLRIRALEHSRRGSLALGRADANAARTFAEAAGDTDAEVLATVALAIMDFNDSGIRRSLEALEQQRGRGSAEAQAVVLRWLGGIYIHQNDFLQAERDLRDAIRLGDEDTRHWAHYSLSQLAWKKGDLSAAQVAMTQVFGNAAMESRPLLEFRALHQLARCQLAQNALPATERTIQRMRALPLATRSVHAALVGLNLTYLNFQREDFGAAIASLNEIEGGIQPSKQPEVAFLRGWLHWLNLDDESAARCFQEGASPAVSFICEASLAFITGQALPNAETSRDAQEADFHSALQAARDGRSLAPTMPLGRVFAVALSRRLTAKA